MDTFGSLPFVIGGEYVSVRDLLMVARKVPSQADALLPAESGEPTAAEIGANMRSAFARATAAAVGEAHRAGLAVPGRRDGSAIEVDPQHRVRGIEERQERSWSPLDWKKGRPGQQGRRALTRRSHRPVIRNIVVGGRRTSVRLEPVMWKALRDIAGRRQLSVHDLITEIALLRYAPTLSAAIRVYIVDFYRAAAAVGPSESSDLDRRSLRT